MVAYFKNERKYFESVGKMFLNDGEEKTKKVLEDLKTVRAFENKYEKLEHYFNQFSAMKMFKKMNYSDKTIFIASMLLMYSPELFILPDYLTHLPRGFVKSIAEAMQYRENGVTKITRCVIFEMRTYEDFKKRVESITDLLKLT